MGIDHKSRVLDLAVAHVVSGTRPIVMDDRVNDEVKGADRVRAEDETAPTVVGQDLKDEVEVATGIL